MKTITITLIHLYQFIKPYIDTLLHSVFGFHFDCKQTPSCSEYTVLQIQKHGTISGLFSGGKRILTCWGF